jgi:uncharacterized protein involved in exopolysaccharide biosynthesis
MNKNPSDPASGIIEVSLGDIFSFFGKYWLVLLLAGLVSGGVGYGISFSFPTEYTSTAKILPEYSSGASPGGLGALASIAGLSLGTMSEAIRPDLYPSILNSRPFLIKALTTPLPTQKDTSILLFTFLGTEGTPAQLADTILTLTNRVFL